jgi:hypothetical protein
LKVKIKGKKGFEIDRAGNLLNFIQPRHPCRHDHLTSPLLSQNNFTNKENETTRMRGGEAGLFDWYACNELSEPIDSAETPGTS